MSKHDERYMWLALVVVVIGTFMSILDTSIVNIAIPKMMTIFGASTDQIEWVLTGYMLTMGIVIPLTGYLGDSFGYKRIYIFALTVFTIGSALCGIASSTQTMVAARVVQAVGGGMIMPIGMSMTYRIIPLEKRGLALGIWGISAMAAPAIGPTLSGYIVEYLDWRLIFMINVPVGIIGVTLAMIILRETPRVKNMKFDLGGALTAGIGLFTLLLALSEASSKGWSSGYIIGLLVVAALSLTTFVLIELVHSQPLLDLRVLKIFPFTLSLFINIVTTIGLFGGVFLIPLYMENLRGYSAMQTGVLMFPSAVATGIAMPISGKLFDKYGAKWLTIIGLAALTISTYVLSKMTMDTPYDTVMLVLIIRGLGMGLCMMPSQTAGMNSIPPAEVGRASALNNTIRQASGSFGIAVLTTIMQNRQAFHAAVYTENLNLNSPQVVQAQAMIQEALSQHGMSMAAAKTGTVLQLFSTVMQQAMASALDDTFLVSAGICLIAIPLAFL
ncbi:MAG TPA: DHA2 family efflux MFS transporter permease subunit, partial [Desulfobacteria bacterium]|nr:DHA2 family efflux MFS transporter permease subunit [Desulfobacteria bacterium]